RRVPLRARDRRPAARAALERDARQGARARALRGAFPARGAAAGRVQFAACRGGWRMAGEYNAAVDLLERNLKAGRGAKTAFVDDAGSCTFAQLAERADRFVNVLHSLGIRREERIAIAMLDTCDWPIVFLGAIKAGVVPVALNTLLTPSDYEYQLRDSRSRALFVSEPLLKSFEPIRKNCHDLAHVVVSGLQLNDLLFKASPKAAAADTKRDDVCFWLYSSGS